jgi:hypothetical protein
MADRPEETEEHDCEERFRNGEEREAPVESEEEREDDAERAEVAEQDDKKRQAKDRKDKGAPVEPEGELVTEV